MSELKRKSREELEQYVLELEQALGKTMANSEFTVGEFKQETNSPSWFDLSKNSVQSNTTSRVLTVDDEEGVRILTKKALRDHPFELLEASSGPHALTIIEEANPPVDVILLDIKMPGMDGFEVLRSLRNNPKTKHIKVIMVSSSSLLEEKVRSFETGASDYLVKPFAKEELLARIAVQINLKKAELALKESEARFRILIENSSDIITLLDADGIIQYTSPSVETIAGYTPKELIGIPIKELIHPDDLLTVVKSFEGPLGKPGGSNTTELRFRRKDGSWCWVEGTGTNLLDNPSIKSIVCNYHDISVWKQAEKLVRESEERYRFIAENANSFISIADMNGDYIYVNDTHQRILGYSKEELIGHSSAIIVHPEDWDYLAQSFAAYIEKGDLFREPIVCRLITKDGLVKWAEMDGRLLLDEQGNPEFIIVIATDITDRKNAEDAMGESKERLNTLLQSSPNFVMDVDHDCDIIYINRSVPGYKIEDTIGTSLFEYVSPEYHEVFRNTIHHVFETAEEAITETVATPPDGITRHFETRFGPTMRDGKVFSVVMIATDITDRKAAENAMAHQVEELQKSEMATLNIMEDLQETISSLEKAEQEMNTLNTELFQAATEQEVLLNSMEEQNQIIGDSQLELAEALGRAVKSEDETKLKNEELIAVQSELREINLHLEERVEERTTQITRLLKQKEDFITQLAHDLRSPLTPLVALMPMLRDKQEDPRSIKMADMAVRNIDYMEELVNQTVQLAKLNSTDAAEFDIQSLSLANVVDELLHTQQYNFIENNVTTSNTVNKEIIVAADNLRLTELLINLATNAIKFMHGGGTLTFDAEVDGNLAIVSVKDTGIGVTEEQADHIFDEFYKADQSRHDLGSAGLGLSICKRITEKHGGGIWVESEGLGKGTTFLFSIPLYTEKQESN